MTTQVSATSRTTVLALDVTVTAARYDPPRDHELVTPREITGEPGPVHLSAPLSNASAVDQPVEAALTSPAENDLRARRAPSTSATSTAPRR